MRTFRKMLGKVLPDVLLPHRVLPILVALIIQLRMILDVVGDLPQLLVGEGVINNVLLGWPNAFPGLGSNNPFHFHIRNIRNIMDCRNIIRNIRNIIRNTRNCFFLHQTRGGLLLWCLLLGFLGHLGEVGWRGETSSSSCSREVSDHRAHGSSIYTPWVRSRGWQLIRYL